MKKHLLAASVLSLVACTAMAETALTTDVDKLSYSIGLDLGKNFKKQGIAVNGTVLSAGFQDGLTEAKPQLTEEQIKQVMSKFQQDMLAKRSEAMNKRAEENRVKGESFLKENQAKPGIVTTASGLQYKIITAGNGKKPGADDAVTVEYTGRLIDGQVFDSSERTGKPASFKLSQVIPGWTEALQLMPAGSTWEVYVPSKLAYGEKAVGGPIGPNETLIFKIHLLSVDK